MRELSSLVDNKYYFYGGLSDSEGIKVFRGDDVVTINEIGFSSSGGKLVISNYRKIFDENPDVLILIGNPNIFSTWLIAIEARLRGIALIFWTHGWIKKENLLKSKIRNIYLNIADYVLVYGESALIKGVESGFSAKKIIPVYNSLDFVAQNKIYENLKFTSRADIRKGLGLELDQAMILCLSRVTAACKYDWLIAAVSKMTKKNLRSVYIIMIGEGEEVEFLKKLAHDNAVDVRFLGSIYDENLLAKYIMAANLVASPGKVGLTAMHSLAYGTPVVTHGDFDRQMPEVEAIIPGVSGCYFDYGNIDSLVMALNNILMCENGELNIDRDSCRSAIVSKFNPANQTKIINNLVDKICGGNLN